MVADMTLLRRIETAEAGSRELSDEVLLELGWEYFPPKSKRYMRPRTWRNEKARVLADHIAPCPTTKLQDAVDLVPEGMPYALIYEPKLEKPLGAIAGDLDLLRMTRAATPALALCAALLRSKGVE